MSAANHIDVSLTGHRWLCGHRPSPKLLLFGGHHCVTHRRSVVPLPDHRRHHALRSCQLHLLRPPPTNDPTPGMRRKMLTIYQRRFLDCLLPSGVQREKKFDPAARFRCRKNIGATNEQFFGATHGEACRVWKCHLQLERYAKRCLRASSHRSTKGLGLVSELGSFFGNTFHPRYFTCTG